MSVLDEIVKAYDIRGTVPDQLNGEIAHALGVAFANFCNADRVLVARDMRRSGEELADEFSRGVMEQGLDIVDIGLASTDMLYYAAGALDAPGAMFTLGTQKEGHEEFLLHHPKFDIDERAMPIGTAMLAETAIRFLKQE